jgi:predicted nucleotidyltransferase
VSEQPVLGRDEIREALRRLGDRLAWRGVVADLFVFGGAAMALAYDLRRSTRDVDALIQPHGVVLAEAQAVALELGLPAWWLKQASAYVAPAGDPRAPLVFDHPGLRVHAASADHLLAMKVLAARRRDQDDIKLLAGHLGLSTMEEVLEVCSAVFPDEAMPDRARLILLDLFAR